MNLAKLFLYLMIRYTLFYEKLDYQIESIDERHKPFIEKNKNQLLNEFLEREKTN